MKHAVIGLAALVLVAGIAPDTALAVEHMYVGVAKCATCHKTAAQGEQLAKWQTTDHAKAYATLAGAKAKELAKAKGIDDPQKAPECLKCHVTGYGADPKLLGEKYLASDGVGCESCHGAGGDYYKKTTMEAIMAGTTDAASVGLVKPDKAACEKCHNKESPSFQGFDFDKMVEKIKHPLPADRKAKYKAPAGG
jgi:Cytochrome c554 and c-prime